VYMMNAPTLDVGLDVFRLIEPFLPASQIAFWTPSNCIFAKISTQ
jgi:hypothetical protein